MSSGPGTCPWACPWRNANQNLPERRRGCLRFLLSPKCRGRRSRRRWPSSDSAPRGLRGRRGTARQIPSSRAPSPPPRRFPDGASARGRTSFSSRGRRRGPSRRAAWTRVRARASSAPALRQRGARASYRWPRAARAARPGRTASGRRPPRAPTPSPARPYEDHKPSAAGRSDHLNPGPRCTGCPLSYRCC